jgi:hypothetical protein
MKMAIASDTSAPLIDRREQQRQGGENRPGLLVGHPRQADVEQQEVREERDRPVLAGGQQDWGREAAEQTEDRDEERLAPDRQDHRERRHQREQAKSRRAVNEVP